ncbi:RluA family pseudouridine synthase [Myxococcota bacterium]|nr:RluA family pseudouridine synthase [Myxococcota bacterium]
MQPKTGDEEQELFLHGVCRAGVRQQPTRLDCFVASRFARFTRARARRACKMGAIHVNGVPKKPAYRVRSLDEIALWLPHPTVMSLTPTPMALDIVYEDADILVINKAAGVVCHPSRGHWEGTLLHGLLHHLCPNLQGDALQDKVFLVHRLDRGTSGLLVVARHLAAAVHFFEQMQAGEIQRIYHAFVWGKFPYDQTTVDAPIAIDPSRPGGSFVPKDPKEGKEAITHIERIAEGADFSRVACCLETGRTHQIRVHLQHLGYPLLGDPHYGATSAFLERIAEDAKPEAEGGIWLDKLPTRQALHAASLRFLHPTTGAQMRFSAELPPDLKVLSDVLQGADVE